MRETLNESARQWLKARDIIAASLADLPNGASNEQNAAAIIARLAMADPPLLLCTPDELKD